MKGLTQKQHDILDFIEEFMDSVGMAPTVYEIAEHFKIKTSTVFAHIRALQKKNQLTRSSKARSINLTHLKRRMHRPSGLKAIPVFDDHKGSLKNELLCDTSLFGCANGGDARNLYAIRVHGGLKNRGILDGDIAIVRKHSGDLKQGDIIVTLVNGSTALMSCEKVADGSMELRAEDSAEAMFKADLSDPALKGVVVGVQRSL